MWERRAASMPSASERRRQNVSHPNSVKVSVSDTGPGIPAEFHLEVFDDFFRLPGNENQEGMGLGLAIARRLVQGMSGKIWVESDPGAGCKFSFLIPYKPAAAAASKGKHR
jgi:signal transduction histidine kinase